MHGIQWMLYGATGYTGVRVAEAAVRRGHRPLLAGRNAKKLKALAKRLGLDYVAFSLDDVNTIADAIAGVDIVYHAAGPFVHTSAPMIRACLATRTHYLDITGEISVYENTFSYDEAARKNGIALISGVGFDVVPTDCLAKYVADQVPAATTLMTGIAAIADPSAGTTKSFLEMMPAGGVVRRGGQLVPHTLGTQARTIRFPIGTLHAMPIPWGDLSTAYRSTGIPDITCYMAMPRSMIRLSRVTAPIGGMLLRLRPVMGLTSMLVDRLVDGPADTALDNNRAYAWAYAANAAGQSAEAWLDTPEAYRYTYEIAIPAIERLAELNPTGALTPSLAFGADFALEAADTQRFDSLD